MNHVQVLFRIHPIDMEFIIIIINLIQMNYKT